MSYFRPIDTAPKDRTILLLIDPAVCSMPFAGFWDGTQYRWWYRQMNHIPINPTLWMRIPYIPGEWSRGSVLNPVGGPDAPQELRKAEPASAAG